MTFTHSEIEQRRDALPYDAFFEDLRKREFSRLDACNQIYLDYTGGNQYPQSLTEQHFHLLQNNVFGNPHSVNPTSKLSAALIEEARNSVLDFFNARDYICIFTQNATGALKIVGESFPFGADSELLLLTDNHNSVNGLREYCARKGGHFAYAPIQYEDLMIDTDALSALLSGSKATGNKLFAFPAQSNVSGVRHDLAWIEKAQADGWRVLLDAAAFVPTSTLDLSIVQPDFVSVSFYKMFGYPTGIGCLLVHKSAFPILQKPWFAGGTVSLVSVQSPHHFLQHTHERFEDGTVNYLGIPAITMGLDFLRAIGMEKIHNRVDALAQALIHSLQQLTHSNGKPLVRIFGPDKHQHSGSTILLNIFDPFAVQYPFEEVELAAAQKGISLRAGCFCNPGIDETNNCLTATALSSYYSSRDDGDFHDMMTYLQVMRGAIRVSVGIATITADLDAFIAFVSSYRDQLRTT